MRRSPAADAADWAAAEDAANEHACFAAAEASGVTAEQALNCDDGDMNCKACPWAATTTERSHEMSTETTWSLDTGTDGEDEHGLIGTRDEVEADILHYHDLQELPAHWTLTEMSTEIRQFKCWELDGHMEYVSAPSPEDAAKAYAEPALSYYIAETRQHLASDGEQGSDWREIDVTVEDDDGIVHTITLSLTDDLEVDPSSL